MSSPKTIMALAVVTGLVTAAAVVTAYQRQVPTAVRYVDQPAFPALRDQPDAVQMVTIQTKDGTITLKREAADRWVVPERYSYPAEGAKLRELVVQLADMRLIEAKTEKPERYARLEVEDVTPGQAKSRLVRLQTADGKTIAEAIVGKRRTRLTGTEPAGTYLRRPGEAQSWLVSGSLELGAEIESWLDQQVVDIGRDQVARVEIRPPQGEAYVASRPNPDAQPVLEGLAPNQVLSEEANLNQLMSALTAVTLADVKPRKELTLPAARHIAKVTTFDGLEATIQLALIDDKPWAIIDAVARPAQAAAVAPAAATPTQPAAPGQPAAGQPASNQPAAASPADPAKLEAAVKAIQTKTSNWAFQVNQSLYQRLTKDKASWLKASDGTS